MSNKETQFKKGISGNYKGAPKKEESITHLMKQYLRKTVNIGKNKKREYKQLFVEKALQLALKGDMTAMKLIWNYMDGLPLQKIENELKGNVVLKFNSDIDD